MDTPHHGARSVALAALMATCVLTGPIPAVVAAIERIAAVAVVDDRRGRGPVRRSRSQRPSVRPVANPRPIAVRPDAHR